jgi:hypothetical protein
MGNNQSTQIKEGSDADYMNKINLFSSIFSKMLKQADIIDIRALTSGPGTCGSYVLLLQKNIEKEFKNLKLASKNDVKEFAFAKLHNIESISDTEACTNLALFYIRALQFVASIMLSVYSPTELLSLIRDKVRKERIASQKIISSVTPSPQQIAQKEILRERWFKQKFLKDTQIPNLFVIDGDEQLSYDSTHDMIMFNDYTTSKQHKAVLKIEELEQYNIRDMDKKGKKYWISLYNSLNGNRITRRLISDSDSSALIYSSQTSESSVMDIPISDTRPGDWTNGLSKELVKMPGEPIPVMAINPVITRNTRKNRRNNSKTSNTITNINSSKTTTLPPEFQNSYDIITKWFDEKESALEMNPGAYRSLLLYNAHIAIGEVDSTNMAADFWQNMPLKKILIFSTLESLFNDNDNGTMSVANENALRDVVRQFSEIYEPFTDNVVINPVNFTDVVFPDLKNIRTNPEWQVNLKERLYDLSDTDGRTKNPCPIERNPATNCWPVGFNEMIAETQKEIQTLQNEHLDNCIVLLKDIFTFDEYTNNVYFTEKFLSDVRGVRAILEDYIVFARKLIAEYYINVETKYYKMVKKLAE